MFEGGTSIKGLIAMPILRGAKIVVFLLATITFVLAISFSYARPAQAGLFNMIGCVIGVGCGVPVQTPLIPPTDNPEAPVIPVNPGDTDEPTDEEGEPEEETPVDPNPVPVVTVSATPALVGGSVENRTVTITGKITDDDFVSCQLLINEVPVDATCVLNEETGEYDLNYTWVVAGEPDTKAQSGEYIVKLIAVDATDRQTAETTKIVVDNDGPAVTVAGGNTIINSGSITPKVTAADDADVASYSWAAGKNPAVLEFDAAAKTPTFTPTIEGTYRFVLTARDALGNQTVVPFEFGYAVVLATLPLPVSNIEELVVNSPVITREVVASSDENVADKDTEVLGNTISTPAPAAFVAQSPTIARTGEGWRIFGLLWYWWLGIVGVMATGWFFVKKYALRTLANDS